MDGLSNLTFGRLAKRLGMADRTIVYYFPTKADLIAGFPTETDALFQQTLDFVADSGLMKGVLPDLATL